MKEQSAEHQETQKHLTKSPHYPSNWSTGLPKREFLCMEDMVETYVDLMNDYDKKEFHNISCGEVISISNLTLMIKISIGFKGEINCDASKPDGTPWKLLDISRLHSTEWWFLNSLQAGIERAFVKDEDKL